MTQAHFDGLQIDQVQGRFTGTFDLDAQDVEHLDLDRVAFFVVAVRVEGASVKVTDTADVKRVNVLKVQDARVATEELREEAIKWLAGKHDPMLFDERLGLAPADGPENEPQIRLISADTIQPEHVDPEISEITEAEVVFPPPQKTTGAILMPTAGPKVAKFRDEMFRDEMSSGAVAPPVTEVEQVGSVYAKRGDDRLARFMESGD